MATDRNDQVTGQLVFSQEAKDWLRMAMDAQIKSFERARDKYPSHSASFQAIDADVKRLIAIKEKI